jgi:thioredoxin 2
MDAVPKALHIVCPHCDTVNRAAVAKLDARVGGNCGVCGKKLFEGEPVALDTERFDRHAARSGIPLVVDFWAEWCGPCKMMAPMFAAAAERLEPRVRLVKVDTEAEQALAARYRIRSIPTLMLLKDGQEIARSAGAMDTNAIVRWVAQYV